MLSADPILQSTEVMLTPSASEFSYRHDGFVTLSVHVTSGGQAVSGGLVLISDTDGLLERQGGWADHGDAEFSFGPLSVGLHHFSASFTAS